MRGLYLVFKDVEEGVKVVTQLRRDLPEQRIREAIAIFLNTRADILETNAFDIRAKRADSDRPHLILHFRDDELVRSSLRFLGNRCADELQPLDSRAKQRALLLLDGRQIRCWAGRKRIREAAPSAQSHSSLDNWIQRIEQGRKISRPRRSQRSTKVVGKWKAWKRLKKLATAVADMQKRAGSPGRGDVMGKGQVSEPYSSGATLSGTYRIK